MIRMGVGGTFFIGQGCVRLKIRYWTVSSDVKLLGNESDEHPLLTGSRH